MKLFKSKDSFIFRFFKVFFKNNLTSSAAELAYYLVFAFFPLLMVVHASFSMVLQEFDIKNTFLYSILPDVVEELLDAYIEHVSTHSNTSFLLVGVLLTIFTLSRFIKSLKNTIRVLYRSHNYKSPVTEIGMSLVFSVLIISAFYASVFLLILGGQLLKFIETHFHIISIIKLQTFSRIAFTGIIIYAVVWLLYFWIPNVKQKAVDIFPGTIFASVCWVLLSGIFSFYMNNFSSYSLIYGSIGAFIMLLTWIYMSCLIILAGAVINALIYNKKNDIHTRKDDNNVNCE